MQILRKVLDRGYLLYKRGSSMIFAIHSPRRVAKYEPSPHTFIEN